MRLRFISNSKSSRGQTALEYAMMVVVVMIPTALAIKGVLQDLSGAKDSSSTGNKQQTNLVRNLVDDAYGTENRMGVIGRPYP
jgi:hypothetical protein